jgi:hypothetical protein
MLYNKQYFGSPTWVLVLNKYQRDNLLFLLNLCGYGSPDIATEPFTIMNNGDWIGEIAIMLGKSICPGAFNATETYTIDKDDQPNTSVKCVRNLITSWIKINKHMSEMT